ncbi:ABC transporter substrate-binding protein [Pseudomonas japonica]|uniref:ABC transporter substrate-binding protein n=1 Tax=Pseudomonas japonica TaxID=256466 RepID=UPI003801515B
MSEPVTTLYSICPLLVASNLAVELGWLDEEFERVGAVPRYLRSLPDNGGWLSHFSHEQPGLIRDGGATPALWARADKADTLLLATTASQRAGQILVRADGQIRRVADLVDKRIGVPVSRATQRIDVLKVVAEQGIDSALALAGVRPEQVQRVLIEDDGDPHDLRPAQRPAALWSQLRNLHSGPGAELRALLDGRVDALHVQAGHVPKLLASGQFSVIEDLEQRPDWTLKNQNGPYVTTVDRAFAEAHPQVVVAFLRAAIRAGRWIEQFPEAAASLLTRVTFLPDAAFIVDSLRGRELVPNLAPRNLAALDLKKQFLVRHGYLQQDFDLHAWVSPDYLAQAHAGL